MGARRDIPEVISQLDIFVFSAKEDEGFGEGNFKALFKSQLFTGTWLQTVGQSKLQKVRLKKKLKVLKIGEELQTILETKISYNFLHNILLTFQK